MNGQIHQNASVQGVQMQERALFLFNDLLLIAKERNSSHFKLKDQVMFIFRGFLPLRIANFLVVLKKKTFV